MSYKKIGGIIDLKFFMSEHNGSPESVFKLYHEYLGGYMIPPFWSLGYNQCRWGYKSINDLEYVLEGFKKNNLPLDTMWLDIDYMD